LEVKKAEQHLIIASCSRRSLRRNEIDQGTGRQIDKIIRVPKPLELPFESVSEASLAVDAKPVRALKLDCTVERGIERLREALGIAPARLLVFEIRRIALREIGRELKGEVVNERTLTEVEYSHGDSRYFIRSRMPLNSVKIKTRVPT